MVFGGDGRRPAAARRRARDAADAAAGPRADSPRQGDLEGERKRLTVGPGIGLSGRITDCDRLVVEGEVRVGLQRVRAVTITATGRFTEGRAEVEEADIGGLYGATSRSTGGC